ncbi:aminoglycoside phosphotransferase family protein [Desulfocurvus vexinensis]|uniref:phosphotransferase n=1 Tax=Desulfocurvus vexinensis TaxID=399548 RepID=UPI0004B73402|nr:aminoglycoside phosphotransferase family protein [Desulfocurvus vexinensis]
MHSFARPGAAHVAPDSSALCAPPPWAVEALAAFGLDCARLRPGLPLAASPERCALRAAVEDRHGALWVLERLHPGQQARREAVARVQQALAAAGLAGVPAWLPARAGGQLWQVAPFVHGDPLPRPAYVEDAARGAAPEHTAPAADLPAFAFELRATVGRTRPALGAALDPILAALAPLFAAWAELPRTLVHGDLHPLNVLWRGQEVAAVVDWEFAGQGPDLYDAANLLGCVGSEDPSALGRGLCAALLAGLRAGGVLRADNAPWLHPLLVAVRLGWLSEWLRKNDREMLDMELDYLRLLTRSRGALERVWGLG